LVGGVRESADVPHLTVWYLHRYRLARSECHGATSSHHPTVLTYLQILNIRSVVTISFYERSRLLGDGRINTLDTEWTEYT